MISHTKVGQVDRRSNLSIREFRHEYLRPRKPVVITDAIDNWAALKVWTLDFFKSRYGNSLVRAFRYEDREYRKAYAPDRQETMRLSSFISAIEAQDFAAYPYYVRDDWRLFIDHPELLNDYQVPEYFVDWFEWLPRFMRLIYPRIFIGGKGAVTPLHIDIWDSHAWLAQVVGHKHWIMYSPDQRGLLYECSVRPLKPDFEKYPRFRQAKAVECITGPGDLIFIPAACAHEVAGLEPSIALSHNFMGPGCVWPCVTNATKENLVKRLWNRSLAEAR
jgi:ribosomal protein L16 Arg81 hydroxylase